MFGGPSSSFSKGTFINLLSLEKFDPTKIALIIKIQLQKHTKYSCIFPAMIFVIQKQSKQIKAVRYSPQWKRIRGLRASSMSTGMLKSPPFSFSSTKSFCSLRKQG